MNTVGQILIFSILKTITAIVFATALLFTSPLMAQWQDDFADGEFFSDPPWQGDADAFVVQEGKLRLNAPADAGSAKLVTSGRGSAGTWEFKAMLDFNPSGSNLVKIYLTSSEADLNGPLQGYFVQIGGSADEISLFKHSGTSRSKIIDGPDGRVDLPGVSAAIRVTRDANGAWQLFSKLDTESDFQEEGKAVDNEFLSSSWFGVHCVFTSTRSDRFYFDEFSFEPVAATDSIAPEVVSVVAGESNRLLVTFSESLPREVLTSSQVYWVSDGVGYPDSVEPHADDRSATLLFERNFAANFAYTLTVGPLRDHAGNESAATGFEFSFISTSRATWKDLVITEIFCDPSPPLSLPQVEFIEIFNRSQNAYSLSGWTLSDLTSSATLEDRVVLPGEFLILTTNAGTALFEPYGPTLGIDRFPSLNNTGDAISLKDDSGSLIDSVYYDDSWYGSDEKKSGGWTLELIDPENLCAENENWAGSESDTGGTPGARNSVYAEKPDLTGPALAQAYAVNVQIVNLIFNEKLEDRIPEGSDFEFSSGPKVSNAALNANLKEIELHLASPLEPGRIYSLKVTRIADCAGNQIVDGYNTAELGLPDVADSLDVVINEILFNPRPNGVDFVELANRSGKYLDLNGWKLGQARDGDCINENVIVSKPAFLKPDSIIALTTNPANIRNEYLRANNLWEMTLPPYNDDSGGVCITDAQGNIIDLSLYDAEMHSPFVREKEGVSLERLSVDAGSDDAANWKSASATAGFATPGFVNSNRVHLHQTGLEFRIEPEVFLAAQGQPDFTIIHYTLGQPDYLANIVIIDSSGRHVKTVAQNSLLGTNGFFRWDGDLDDGTKARIGSYMIKIELFNRTGTTNVILKRVVVAGRF